MDLALVLVYFMFRPLFRFFSHHPNAAHEKDRKKEGSEIGAMAILPHTKKTESERIQGEKKTE